MGQAKKRGTKEERIAQAQARHNNKEQEHKQIMQPQLPYEVLEHLFSNLTTPSNINEQVEQFSKMLSDKKPIFLDCKPELWSRQSCCDMNVSEYIKVHGGRMICGYRIWYNEPLYIEGERHAVWTDGMSLKDVSFVDDGETRILFVPDDLGFNDAPGKIRHSFNEMYSDILKQYDALENNVHRLSSQEAWDRMPTYQQWLDGKRMPNMWIETRRKRDK